MNSNGKSYGNMNHYIHKESLERYSLLQECRLKRGNVWVPGVVYLRNGEMFVRTRTDFDLHFDKE